MIDPNNPFRNPELLHPELAADIANVEAWQAEHTTGENIAVEGLAGVVQQELTTALPELTPKQAELVDDLRNQFSTSLEATNIITNQLNDLPSRQHNKLLEINEVKAKTEFDNKLIEWARNG